MQALGITPIGPPAKSFMGVPLFSGDQAIGMIAVRDFHNENAFAPADVQLLQTIATQAASAIVNAQLYEQSQRQTRELSALNRISVQASTSLELDKVLSTILHEAVEVLPFQKAAIFLADEDGKTMTVVNSTGLSPEYQQQSRRLDIASNVRTEAIRRGQMAVVPDITKDPYFRKILAIGEAEGFRSFVENPLFSGDQLIGSFTAYYEEPHRFTFDELKLIQTLCGQVAVAVEQARLLINAPPNQRAGNPLRCQHGDQCVAIARKHPAGADDQRHRRSGYTVVYYTRDAGGSANITLRPAQ